jgi:hypothetical protein
MSYNIVQQIRKTMRLGTYLATALLTLSTAANATTIAFEH